MSQEYRVLGLQQQQQQQKMNYSIRGCDMSVLVIYNLPWQSHIDRTIELYLRNARTLYNREQSMSCW